MKLAVLTLAASVCLAIPAFAQDDAPAAAPPATGGAAPAGAAGGKGANMKAAVETCRNEIKAQGVKGPDRKKAVMDCVSKEHPEFAGRMQCRQDGMAKGLAGDELKSFIKTCVKSSHG